MAKDRNKYKIEILFEDLQINECVIKFKSKDELLKFAEDYLDGNDYTMNVYDFRGKKIHSFVYGIGSHNRMKLYDNA